MVRLGLWATLVSLSFLALGCGGRTLDTPEGLAIRTYPSGQDFTMTFIMRSCSDTCSVYEPAECEVDVDSENKTIEVDAKVSYESKDGADELTTCTLQCGPQVLAHCVVPSLTPGTYQVVAKTFRAQIEVR